METDKIYACAFGDDGCTGDSAFGPVFFDTEGSEDWDTLVDLWRKSVGWLEEEDEYMGSPVEFYLVDEKHKDIIDDGIVDCGNDSAVYVMAHTLKTLITQLAIKKISQ